ncbi:hypothetical protein CBR_g40367 [Chara braunii]|uniref:Uncharacterized protein n=1 Tax=Chara braunii TaxID=69332 RepID=A0A388LTH8_CHABU|nr:hypothetical protein CBR_g40367 [Chara braunii]|eukprot:GBG85638.1 hypothetical protein CBR_g40367 [Chara braunii]
MEVSPSPSPRRRHLHLHLHPHLHSRVSSIFVFIFVFIATYSLTLLLLLSDLPSQAEAADAIKLTSTSTSSPTTRRVIRRTPRFPVPRTGVWGPQPVPVPVPVPIPIPVPIAGPITVDSEQQGGPPFSILSPQEQQQLQQQHEEKEKAEGEREKGEEREREKGEEGKEVVKGDDAKDQQGEHVNLLKEYVYETKYYTQVLDHFSFERSEERFQQRYLVNDKHWDKENGGPIFMYCGNEGGIETFVFNTGFMWDIAPEFGAMVLFVEHRYYGKSMPFGSTETALQNASTLGYLTSEQAIADFATLLIDLKRNLTAEENPVVLFGGSYGGTCACNRRFCLLENGNYDYMDQQVCKRIDNAPRGSDLLARIFAGVSIFYNYTGGQKCFDLDSDSDVLGTRAWYYQTCTEMVMPFASNPNNSMFEPYDWDLNAYIKSCQDDFGVTPRPNWITTQYESRDIRTVLKHFGSNIVFSNGLLDPWSGGW